MNHLNALIHKLISFRQRSNIRMTLLAVCPNSAAVLEAAIKAAAQNNAPMLFAATLNQVDVDGGYTGWTPHDFVLQMQSLAKKYHWDGPLYPCLDHGGPWLKDRHTIDRLSYLETMQRVKNSLRACLDAGYQLLHIDPTVDRTLSPGDELPLDIVVERTIEMITCCEDHLQEGSLPPIAYEVGTEEVHGGLVDNTRFDIFLKQLRDGLGASNLMQAWPCFVVAQVGTDLHTTSFNPTAARHLFEKLAPLSSLAKGHYTDWVANPWDYPLTGMGGANVGPEFTAVEFEVLKELEQKESILCRNRSGLQPSSFMLALRNAVISSDRWKKWLLPSEKGLDFSQLQPARQDWLLQTGSRYIWTQSEVVSARQHLYQNLSLVMPDPNIFVVDRIVLSIDRYIRAFGLFDALSIL